MDSWLSIYTRFLFICWLINVSRTITDVKFEFYNVKSFSFYLSKGIISKYGLIPPKFIKKLKNILVIEENKIFFFYLFFYSKYSLFPIWKISKNSWIRWSENEKSSNFKLIWIEINKIMKKKEYKKLKNGVEWSMIIRTQVLYFWWQLISFLLLCHNRSHHRKYFRHRC